MIRKSHASAYRVKQQILKELYFNKFLSCAEISALVKKSLPIVAKLITELVEENYVIEQGFAPSSGGRRPLIYALKPDSKLIVAVAMDQLTTRVVLYDLQNHKIYDSEGIDLPLNNNRDAVDQLINLINSVIEQSGVDKANIIGVGIGMPGFVDVKNGINYSFLHSPDMPLKDKLTNALDLPVYIDNDSCLIALAELRLGAAKAKQNVMVINIAWGIGLGMIVNGEIFRGHSGFAGEFSHIPTSEQGRLCSCGKTGCLETDASLLLVVERAKEGINNGRISSLKTDFEKGAAPAGDLVLQAANKGDQYAIELLSEAGYAIGKGLAILIHIMNPEIIVLSGRGAVAGKIFLASIQQALHTYAIPRLAENTHIEISKLGYDAQLIGAAALVMKKAANKIHQEELLNAL